jgi:RNA recognition motif-containing protein
MNIYVGNLSYDCNEQDLRNAFSVHGAVDAARLVTDRDTGRPKGFAFVEMPNDAEAQAAINALNGTMLRDREMKVNEARPREDRPAGGGYRGGGNKSYGGGGGGGGRGRW